MRSQDMSATNGDRRTSSLAALAVILIIVTVSLVIVRKLQVRVLLEACVQTQRPGCELTADRLRVSRLLDRLTVP